MGEFTGVCVRETVWCETKRKKKDGREENRESAASVNTDVQPL